jgi:hypothetical protein
MKTSYGIILILAIAAALFAPTLPCRAVEKEDEEIWSEDTAKGEHGRFELTEEKIELIMKRLAVTDPNKAEQLKQLQEKDPNKFKIELREAMREQRGKRIREHIGKRLEPIGPGEMPPGACNMPHIPSVMPGPNVMPPEVGMQRRIRPFGRGRMPREMDMQWRQDKFLDWLRENYTDVAKQLEEAQKLAEKSGDDAEQWQEYWKQFGLNFKKYGRIAEAARENPRLAEVLKQDLELRQQQDKLLEEIENAKAQEKEVLINELKKVLSSRFDVIVERKQIEYEQLLERLERLKNDVEQRKATMEKWKNAKFKDDSVKARLEELLGKSDKFTW